MTDIPEPEWAEQRRWWYSQTYIGLEMAKILQHRELVFLEKKNPAQQETGRKLKTIRCCAGYTYDLIKSNFNSFAILDHPFVNMYYSLMHLEKMPLFSFAPAVRAQKYVEWTNGGYKEQYAGYDFALDFDGDDGLDQALKDCLRVKEIFDEFKIPYSVRFSGSRGFHLCVDSKWLPQLPEQKIVALCGELGTMIKEIEGLSTLDDSIFDSRRVFKLPYSFCQGKIVLPLDDYQLANFTPQLVSPEYVQKAIQIKGRGLLERHSDQTEEQARASFIRMSREFINPDVFLK
jgi:hypothetical protein